MAETSTQAPTELKRMRVGFLCQHDPLDKSSLSGSVHYLYSALTERPELDVICIPTNELNKDGLLQRINSKIGEFVQPVDERRKKTLDNIINRAQYDLEQLDQAFDFIVAPFCAKLLSAIGYMIKDTPVIYVTDATPNFLKETYNRPIAYDAIVAEKLSLKHAFAVIYSCKYMLNRAREEFANELSSITSNAIPFGLNIDGAPHEHTPKSDIREQINLLFVGKEWERKGGETALKIHNRLRRKGYNAHLTIIGCAPEVKGDSITVEAYADKNSDEGAQFLNQAYSNAHFLLLPTQGDCTPMVIAEANAFSVPAIASPVGGIPEQIQTGKNGYLMKHPQDWESSMAFIERSIEDQKQYEQLSKTSFKHYAQTPEWGCFVKKLLELAPQEQKLDS